MGIEKRNSPTEEELRKVRRVEAACKAFDGLSGDLSLDGSLNVDSDLPWLYYYEEDGYLVGILTLFMPLREEVEISAYTLPEHRRKGYCSKLLREAMADLSPHLPLDLLFVCEPRSVAGMEAIRAFGGQWSNREYAMQFEKEYKQVGGEQLSGFTLKRAEMKDLAQLHRIRENTFSWPADEAESTMERFLQSQNRIQYMASWNGSPVGIGAIGLEENRATFYGLGIEPAEQGKGLGKALLRSLLEEAKKRNVEELYIEVDSSNEKALHLYLSQGFQIKTTFDYFRKPLP